MDIIIIKTFGMIKMTEEGSKIVLLKWDHDNTKFIPIESEVSMDEGVFIELVDEDKIWKYFYIKGASLIARRTALRSANGIAKTGYLHPKDNIRYGLGCKLEEEVSPYEDMPGNLRNTQRSWYGGEYKQF